MRDRLYYVYIVASRRNGTIYTGITGNLARRAWEHREGLIEGFTERHGVKHLVWYEVHQDVHAAIQREKNIKHWSRAWKLALIEKANPQWHDLFATLSP